MVRSSAVKSTAAKSERFTSSMSADSVDSPGRQTVHHGQISTLSASLSISCWAVGLACVLEARNNFGLHHSEVGMEHSFLGKENAWAMPTQLPDRDKSTYLSLCSTNFVEMIASGLTGT